MIFRVSFAWEWMKLQLLMSVVMWVFKSMDVFVWKLSKVTENFISLMPEVLVFFYYGLHCV